MARGGNSICCSNDDRLLSMLAPFVPTILQSVLRGEDAEPLKPASQGKLRGVMQTENRKNGGLLTGS